MAPSKTKTAKLGGRDASPQSASDGQSKPEAKSTAFGRLRQSIGLDLFTVLMMLKAALPPAIALAIFQADSVARIFTTLGYVPALVSVFGFCILPRAKFLQTMLFNVLAVCVAAAVAMLMCWSAVQARLHTTPAGVRVPYNSAQSTVCGIWLFFNIYLANALKAKSPQLAFPTTLYAIFINMAATYGPQFHTTAQAEAFVQRLVEAFLTGCALATGVSLVVVPVSCRKVVMKEMTGYIMTLRASLGTHRRYIQSLETSDMLLAPPAGAKDPPAVSREVEELKKTTAALAELHGKLYGDLPFAKREAAFGHLGPEDLSDIAKMLRAVMVPVLGLGTLADVFSRVAEEKPWNQEPQWDPSSAEAEEQRRKIVGEWNHIMAAVHDPFADVLGAADEGLEHALLRLRLIPPAKSKPSHADVEAQDGAIRPGDAGFAEAFRKRIQAFIHGREETLRLWCEAKGIQLPPGALHRAASERLDADAVESASFNMHQRSRRQLHLYLYMTGLLCSATRAVLALVDHADKLEAEKRFARRRIILPGKRRLTKWLGNVFRIEDATQEDSRAIGGIDGNNTIIYLGEAFQKRKDPEHLPPQNAWERCGNGIRQLARFLRSPESAFGLRVACATMSIAVVAYLRDTQQFFMKQRLVWAMIMVAISMTPTAGQSVFSFLMRVLGTTIAMVLSFLMWYIPDQKTAGVIVFAWVFIALGFWVPLKRPKYLVSGLIGIVTAVLIIGYELEVRKIGKAAATSNGPPYYPIYKLGPYRLGTVAGGLAVAFVWVFFPFPISEHSALRQSLGASLYLLSNYYSIVHETVLGRIRGEEGDVEDRSSPGYQLAKARNKVFSKQMLLLRGLNTNASFAKWEFPLGGKFPTHEYDTIIHCVSNILKYMALISHVSQTFSQPELVYGDDASSAQWLKDMRKVLSSVRVTSHEITSFLALLSSSISNGQPLPPYLAVPKGYELAKHLDQVDHNILSLQHVAEPGYAAFAVLQVSTRCIIWDLSRLLGAVKNLVGELDFSFHIVSTQNSSGTASDTNSSKEASLRSKQD